MAEITKIGYKRLLEVRITHHYWLDDGAEDFQGPFHTQDSAEKTKKRLERNRRIALYDARKVLSVRPTPATTEQIRQLGGVFRETGAGFLVAVLEGTQVPLTAQFDFMVTVEDSNFFQYTALPFFKNDTSKAARSQKIVEVRVDGKVYRYKPNVFVLSNATGTTRTLNAQQIDPTAVAQTPPQKRFYLTREIPDFSPTATYLAESLVKNGNALFRAMVDKPPAQPPPQRGLTQPSVHWHELTLPIQAPNEPPTFTFDRLPAYVNQLDIPDITPLPGAAGTPAKGVLLTDGMPDDLLMLIKIGAAPVGAAADFHLLNNGQLRTPHPVFDIHFKNRSTFWRTYDKASNSLKEFAFNPPRGLTAFGNAWLNSNSNNNNPNGKKPASPWVNFQTSPAGDLTKLYSDII